MRPKVGTLIAAFFSLSLGLGLSVPPKDCIRSDANLVALHELFCASMGPAWQCPIGNFTAARDWPTQAVYMKNILAAVVDPATCLNSTVATGIIEWLNTFSTDPEFSMWWWNWYIFQPQYYDMPRKQGARIESPATLGRKCWAFAYLNQIWVDLRPQLIDTMDRTNINITSYVAAYDELLPCLSNYANKSWPTVLPTQRTIQSSAMALVQKLLVSSLSGSAGRTAIIMQLALAFVPLETAGGMTPLHFHFRVMTKATNGVPTSCSL